MLKSFSWQASGLSLSGLGSEPRILVFSYSRFTAKLELLPYSLGRTYFIVYSRGAQLMRDNLKVVWAESSTLN
jgi:hypothetical protein